MKYFSKKRFTMRQVVGLLTGVFLGITVIAYAAVTVPNTFSSGTTISSSQVNANFTALGNAMPAAKTITGPFTWVTTTSPVDALSLTVTPPGNGFVIVSGSGTLGLNVTTAGYSRIDVYLTTTSGGTSATARQFLLTNNTTYFNWAPFNVQDIFPVTGGTPITFYLTAAKDAVTSNYAAYVGSSSNDTKLTAIFVPGTALP